MTIYDVKIDPEFAGRLRRQSDEEAREMKESIDQHGYLNPLIVWKETGLLVDGHHRYHDWSERRKAFEKSKPGAIGSKFGRTQGDPPPCPEIVEMSFPDRDAVLVFIAKLQYGKRNLTADEMALLRADFMKSASTRHGTNKAAAMSADTFGTSTRTALRDLEFANAVEALAPVASENGIDVVSVLASPDSAPDRSDVIKAAELVESDPDESLKLITTARREKKSLARVQSAKTPKWMRLIARFEIELGKETQRLASLRDERHAMKRCLNEMMKRLFPGHAVKPIEMKEVA